MRMHRRSFATSLLGTSAAASVWPLAARAQQPAMPVIGYLSVQSQADDYIYGMALRKGLSEQGFIEGRNINIDRRGTEEYDRLPLLAAELVNRGVAAIYAHTNLNTAQAAKA